MQVLSGKEVQKYHIEKLQQEIQNYTIKPSLHVILVGDDPASQTYVRAKERMCSKLGIFSKVHRFNSNVTQKEILASIEILNNDTYVHGLLVQLPLPSHIDEKEILRAIDPRKDVDGFHLMHVGNLWNGTPDVVPCTPKGILNMLKYYNISCESKHVVVVGRSNIVGKPIAALLLRENATVTIVHQKTRNVEAILKNADIIISAAGKPQFITSDMVRHNAVCIDVGINRLDSGMLVGDFDFDDIISTHKNISISPVPGGVGPMTIAMLMENVVELYNLQRKEG